jgi:hypothetical protein
MLQCLLAFLDEIIPLSIASMASSSASLIHLLLMLSTMLHLLSVLCFLVGFCAKDGETFFCLVLVVVAIHFASFEAHLTS